MTLAESMSELMDCAHPGLEGLYYAEVVCSLRIPGIGWYWSVIAVHGTANLFVDEKLVIDNTSEQRGGDFCFGKGTAEEKAAMHLEQGREHKVRVSFASAPASKIVKPGVVSEYKITREILA
jgi:beta-glucosidase